MTKHPVALLVASLLAATFSFLPRDAAAEDERKGGNEKKSNKVTILLDGVQEIVNFNDGDTFRILEGARKDQKARLVGYNTLESYGPVHFWGSANGWDLYHVNEKDIELARSERWMCTSQGTVDGYGRILVVCPELRKRMIAEGYAHVYAYGDEQPDPDLVALMLKAQNERRGMWKYGIPEAIVTSVHSVDEKDPDEPGVGNVKEAHNTMADTRTGKTYAVNHTTVFKPCDVFCNAGSCMVYVPFDSRFGKKRPACMKGKDGEKNRMDGPRHMNEPLEDK